MEPAENTAMPDWIVTLEGAALEIRPMSHFLDAQDCWGWPPSTVWVGWGPTQWWYRVGLSHVIGRCFPQEFPLSVFMGLVGWQKVLGPLVCIPAPSPHQQSSPQCSSYSHQLSLGFLVGHFPSYQYRSIILGCDTWHFAFLSSEGGSFLVFDIIIISKGKQNAFVKKKNN